jgi:hypothetical protein
MEEKFLKDVPLTDVNMSDAKVHALLVSPPNPKGGYRIGEKLEYSVQFNIEHKPNWIQRFFMRKFFGLYWFDKGE